MSFEFVINPLGLKEEEENVIIKYNKEQKGKEILNSLTSVNTNNIDLEVLGSNIEEKVNIDLSFDFTNYIFVDFSPAKHEKKYNIEILINDDLNNSDIIIEKENEKIPIILTYNDLNISRIIILNTTLDLKLYLKSKYDSQLEYKDEIIKQKDEIIENKNVLFQNVLEEFNKVSPENVKKIKLDEMKSNDKLLNRKRYDDIFSIYKTPRKVNKKLKDNNSINKKDDSNNDMNISDYMSHFENNKKKEKEIAFTVNENFIKGKNVRFCINVFSKKYIMTIHDMDETIQNYSFSNINESELNDLYEKISQTMNNLIDKIKKINSNSKLTKITDINYTYTSEILPYIYNKENLDEKDFFLYIEYCYKYIVTNTINIINNIITEFNNSYKEPQENIFNFVKNIIINTLKKINYFHEYVKYYRNEKNNVQNLYLPNENNSFKEKIGYLSIVLTIIFSSPFFETNKKIELFYLDKNENSIYNNARKFMFQIIEKLEPSSIFIKGLLRTTSRIKPDLNEENKFHYSNNDKQNIFILELKNLKELKEEIKKYYPERIIRFVDSKSSAAAYFDMSSGDILINEYIYMQYDNKFLEKDDNAIYNELDNYVKGNIELENNENKNKFYLFMFRAFWRLNHEGFGHKPISIINKGIYDTPTKTLLNESFKDSSDAGEIIEYYIVDEKKDLFNYLKHGSFNIEQLLDVNLYIKESFNKFWFIFNSIEKEEANPKLEESGEKIKFYNSIIELFNSENACKNEKHILNSFFMNKSIFTNNSNNSFKRRRKI